jgi:O-antigen/teichoic acid export membrane protein
MDIIFIGVLLGASQVGAYAVAYRLIFLFFLTFSFVSLAVFPASSRLFKDSFEEYIALAQRSLGVVILLSVPASIGIMLVAPEAIELIFGEGFEASARLLQGLAVLVAMFPMVIVMQTLLDSSDRQTFTMMSELVGVVVGLAAHSILIPLFGLQGAVTAAIISETAIMAFVIFLFRDIISWPQLATRLGIAALGTAAFTLLLLALPPLPIFITIPLAGVVYLCVIASFRGVRAQELSAIIQLARKSDA